METNAANKWLKRNLKRLIKQFCLEHWQITVKVESEEREGWQRAASVAINARYLQASITLFPAQIETESDLARFLQHEFLHILLSPYELFTDIVKAKLDDPIIDEAFDIACEHSVKNLENYINRINKTL